MTYTAVKFNFQQVLLKTLIPTMNTLKDMAVLNIVKTVGKCAPEAEREGLESSGALYCCCPVKLQCLRQKQMQGLLT